MHRFDPQTYGTTSCSPFRAHTVNLVAHLSALIARCTLLLIFACCLTLASLFTCVVYPTQALAETTEIYDVADEFQQEIEDTGAAYDDATERVAELETQVAENEATIAQLEADLPEKKESASQALRELYFMKNEASSFFMLILNAQTLSDFFTITDYISYIYTSNYNELLSLQTMQEELEETQASLDKAQEQAMVEQESAAKALAAAQAAREEAQAEAERLAAEEAAALAAAEEAAALAAAEEEAAAQAEQEEAEVEEDESSSDDNSDSSSDSSSDDSNNSSSESVTPPSSDGADWSSDKTTFVAEWSTRIDAYLSGSPLAGQGSTFAEAAWDYGVDPRWSPAISYTESSKGLYCYYSYNAWGWGSISWSSWEEAINAHVKGLANGYGYTISTDSAMKYCPSNWEHWYSVTSAQMDLI